MSISFFSSSSFFFFSPHLEKKYLNREKGLRLYLKKKKKKKKSFPTSPSHHETMSNLIEIKRILKEKDYYEILKLERTATESEVTTAFKKLAMKVHPDKCPGIEGAAEAFKKVGNVKEVLLNYNSRVIYDSFREGEARSAFQSGSSCGRRSRPDHRHYQQQQQQQYSANPLIIIGILITFLMFLLPLVHLFFSYFVFPLFNFICSFLLIPLFDFLSNFFPLFIFGALIIALPWNFRIGVLFLLLCSVLNDSKITVSVFY